MKTILLASIPILLAGAILFGPVRSLTGRSGRARAGDAPVTISLPGHTGTSTPEPDQTGNRTVADCENEIFTKNIIVCIL